MRVSLPKGGETFQLNEKEAALAASWLRYHRSNRKRCAMLRANLEQAISYQFTPAGIGTVVHVVCGCGERKNVTDYESW